MPFKAEYQNTKFSKLSTFFRTICNPFRNADFKAQTSFQKLFLGGDFQSRNALLAASSSLYSFHYRDVRALLESGNLSDSKTIRSIAVVYGDLLTLSVERTPDNAFREIFLALESARMPDIAKRVLAPYVRALSITCKDFQINLLLERGDVKDYSASNALASLIVDEKLRAGALRAIRQNPKFSRQADFYREFPSLAPEEYQLQYWAAFYARNHGKWARKA